MSCPSYPSLLATIEHCGGSRQKRERAVPVGTVATVRVAFGIVGREQRSQDHDIFDIVPPAVRANAMT